LQDRVLSDSARSTSAQKRILENVTALDVGVRRIRRRSAPADCAPDEFISSATPLLASPAMLRKMTARLARRILSI
jgi:hypothetical protein